jgi:hypothetical protein
LSWIKEDWPSGHFSNDSKWQEVWNNNVRVAVLYDNEVSTSTLKIDYAAEVINKFNDPQWIVFPWEEWWKKWRPNEEHIKT